MATANDLRNCTAGVQVSDEVKSPFELWRGYRPDFTEYRVWGCHVEFYEKFPDKLAARTSRGTFIGCGKSFKQY